MFLAYLSKEEKSIFIEIAIQMVIADGKLDAKEKKLIAAFCNEMQLEEPKNFSNIKNVDLLCDRIAEISTKKTKRIFFVELFGLANIDGVYSEEEKKIVNIIVQKFKLESIKDKLEDVLKKYEDATENLINLVQLEEE